MKEVLKYDYYKYKLIYILKKKKYRFEEMI